MTERQRMSLMEHFSEVPDPRVLRTQRHELLDIFAMALCAVIGGADHWTEVVEFAQARQAWFATFLKLANGHPLSRHLRPCVSPGGRCRLRERLQSVAGKRSRTSSRHHRH